MPILIIEIDSLSSSGSDTQSFHSHVSSSPYVGATKTSGGVCMTLREVVTRPGIDGTTNQIAVFVIEFGLGFTASIAATWFVKWLRDKFTCEPHIDKKEVEELFVYLNKDSTNSGTIVIKKHKVIITRTSQRT